MVGRGKRRQYTLEMIKDMAISAYEQGLLDKFELALCLQRVHAESEGVGDFPEQLREGA